MNETTQHITLELNQEEIDIGYTVYIGTNIPEYEKITEITVVDCPQEILDSFGESEIEQMIYDKLIRKG